MAYNFRNLVFEGGGVKGIAYVGAMDVLKEKGILEQIQRVGGTSAGAINATLFALGFSNAEQHRILSKLNFKNFLDDFQQYNAQLFGRISYRIFRGLSLNLSGSASLIRNQIYLPKGGATDEEILLERRSLATDSRFRFGLGFNYTFGSIYNNIVNSRLTRGGRGFTSIF